MPRAARLDGSTIRFGEYEFVVDSGELSRGGTRLAVQEQPIRVLTTLLASPGQVVTREELRDELWPPHIHVDFDHSLNVAVRRLREVLGDTAETPRFVETLPRRGYRFIAPVQRVPTSAPPCRRSVAVLPFVNLTEDASNEYFCDGVTEDIITELSRVDALRVVSRTSAMRFRDARRDLREVAWALRVDRVVEGSVRRIGERVRIAARLVDAHTEEQVWAETYDRELTDIFRIQQDVAAHVARALAPDQSIGERSTRQPRTPCDVEAYRLYLQGRHLLFRFTEAGIRQAIEYFDRAVSRDPAYALPHAGTGFAYMVLGIGHGAGMLPPREAHARSRRAIDRAVSRDPAYALPHAGTGFAYMVLGIGHGAGMLPPREAHARSRRAIDRALALDPLLGEGHGVDACLKFMFDYDWTGAERAFERAIELGPASAETFDTHGLLMSALGRYDEALAAQRHAHDLDPLAPVVMSDIASTLLRAGRIDEALEQAEALIRLEPMFPMAHSTRGWASIRKGAHDDGLRALEHAVRLSPGNTLFLAQLGQAYAMTGAVGQATEVMARLDALARERYVCPYHLAYVHTGLGDAERAIDCLERAVEERSGGVYGVRGSFLFTALHRHPRFVTLLRRMHLA